MWRCLCCGKTLDVQPEAMKCPNCGLTLGRTEATKEKYNILRKICELNDYALIIDACAGSGKVQVNGELIDGSPLIINEISRRRVPPAKCVYIEADQKTFRLLRWKFCGNINAQFIYGDCNKYLLRLIDGRAPTLVYIDPFGFGVPAIRGDIILELSKIPNTDLLINFSWRIAREMGHARKYLNCSIDRCPSPSNMSAKVESCDKCPTRKKALKYAEDLNTWWSLRDDPTEWLRWGSLKNDEYARRYAEPLMENNRVQIFPIPKFAKTTYHLIFATKFKTLKTGLLRWME